MTDERSWLVVMKRRKRARNLRGARILVRGVQVSAGIVGFIVLVVLINVGWNMLGQVLEGRVPVASILGWLGWLS